MANTKNNTADTVAQLEETTPAKVEDTAPKKVDYNQLVDVFIPRDDSAKKSKTMRLSLNGKSIKVPRGKLVKIPLKYKLMLDEKAALRDMDDSYKDKLRRELEKGDN